jgi:hypothetical protein
MAKKNLGRLAGLAALAGAAYMASKGKDKDDAGDQKTSSYTGDTKKVEALEDAFTPTNESSYTPGGTGTTRPGVGDATNDLVVKPAPAADKPAGLTTPVSSANRTDQLTNLSRAVKREAKTKKFAQEVPEELSAQKTDALRVSSRAAAAADARRRAAKQSSYKSGGMTSSASKRADGIASRGKTKCKMY